MSSGASSAGMAAYQHMPNSTGTNSASNMTPSAGMHGIGNSPGTSHFISFCLVTSSCCQVDGAVCASGSNLEIFRDVIVFTVLKCVIMLVSS